MQFSKNDITPHAFDEQFNELITAITLIIEKHASLQKATRTQKWQSKPWSIKGLLISIKRKQKLYRTII